MIQIKRSDPQRAVDILRRRYPSWVFTVDKLTSDVLANRGDKEIRITFEQIQDDFSPESWFKHLKQNLDI